MSQSSQSQLRETNVAKSCRRDLEQDFLAFYAFKRFHGLIQRESENHKYCEKRVCKSVCL